MNIFAEERLRRGLSPQAVAEQAGLPKDVIDALESDNPSFPPPGHVRDRYVRRYKEFLGIPVLPEDATNTLTRVPVSGSGRSLALAFVGTLGVVLLVRGAGWAVDAFDRWQADTAAAAARPAVAPAPDAAGATPDTPAAGASLPAEAPGAGVEPSGAPAEAASAASVSPGHVVEVRAIESVHATVGIEGAPPAHDGPLAPGESTRATGEGPLVAEVSDLSRVVITYNGSRVLPLHDLEAPRRLVFLPPARD